MKHLNERMTIAESKFIDFALGHFESEEGLIDAKQAFSR
jgi:hypothetical protein